jgi:hypothetical protein
MKRWRAIAAVVALALALGTMWWLFTDRLTAEERSLVGTWKMCPHPILGSGEWTFGSDRQSRSWRRGPSESGSTGRFGYWHLRGNTIIIEDEDAYDRTVRRLLRAVGYFHSDGMTYTADSITPDEIVFVGPDGTREVWTRDRGERPASTDYRAPIRNALYFGIYTNDANQQSHD